MKLWIQFCVLAVAVNAHAVPEFIPLQEFSQGQSLAGASQINDSLFSNPAGAAFTKVYSVDGTFAPPKTFAVSVLDTKTSGIGGGLAYFRKKIGDFEKPLQGARLNFSGQISEELGLGIGGKALWGPNLIGGDDKLNDLDLGVLTSLGFVQLGLTLRNMLGGNEAMDLPRELSFGGRIGWENTLYLSVATLARLDNMSPYQYGIGAEYVSPWYFAIKGGFRTQPQRQLSFWSGGLSFVSPRLSLHYGVEFPQALGARTEHQVGATLLF